MTVWKQTRHGAPAWVHLVYRIDAEIPARRTTERDS